MSSGCEKIVHAAGAQLELGQFYEIKNALNIIQIDLVF